MYTQPAHIVIPKYSLLQSGGLNDLFEIRLLTDHSRQHPSIFLEPHRKDYYMLVLVRQGSSRHWVDMQPYTLQPDTLYFSIPHQVHVKEQSMPIEGIILCFTDAFLAIEENQFLKQLPIIQNPHNGHELLLNNTQVTYISNVMHQMVDEYSEKQDWHNGMLLAYLRVLLIYLSRLYTEKFRDMDDQPDRVLLKKYRALIEAHYRELHEVAAYADMLNITAGHLGDVIRQQSGKTALEHIHERLQLEARRLLFHTDDSVKEIAFALGFEDASYFNRFFKRRCDQTPGDYRAVSRKMYH